MTGGRSSSSRPPTWSTPARPSTWSSTDYTQLPAGIPDHGAHPRQRRHPAGADPVREGGGAAALVPQGRGLRLQHRRARRHRRRRPRRVPHARSPTAARGYCEQFASAMAVMARMLGIPARVAVGFLEPDAGRRRTPGCTARTTCTPGRSCSSPAPAGCASSRRRPAARDRAAATPRRCRSPTATRCRRPALAPRRAPARPRAGARRRGSRTSAGPRRPSRHRHGRRRGCGAASAASAALGLLVAAAAAPRPAPAPRASAGWPAAPRRRGPSCARPRVDLGVPWPAGRSPRETATRLVDHFGAPVDDDTPERPRARPRRVAPRPSTRSTGSSTTLELLRYARTAAPRRPPSARAGRDPDLCRGAARRRRPGARGGGPSGGRARC